MNIDKNPKTTKVAGGILGIDYGASRIGLAFGRDGIVAPLRVISGRDSLSAITDILRLAKDYKASKIIIGLPLSASGKETPESMEVRKFAKLLRARTQIPVLFINELYSSKEAFPMMLNAGISQKSRREDDQFSATIILNRYFEDENSVIP